MAFITTRATVKSYTPPTGCNFLTPDTPSDPCIFDENKTPAQTLTNESYIGDIEDYTLMIEHSVRGRATSVAVRNGQMDGKLMSSNGKTVIKEWTKTNEDPRDIVKVSDLLLAAGTDLEAPSTDPGAQNGESYRSSGIVIIVVIEYRNVKLKKDKFSYKYLPRMIEGNEYKVVESLYQADGSYILKDRHGIRFVFAQHGEIGEFSFIALLENIVAGFALFKLATILVEIIMLKFLPEKDIYEDAKYEETNDLHELRKRSGDN